MDATWSADWPRPGGKPAASGVLKARIEDFRVDEVLGFEPVGDGEHLLVRLRKTDLNTADVAERLARWGGVPLRDVGYCGRKDRRAVTSQWFSVRAPRDTPAPDELGAGVSVLTVVRHRRKLRRGAHRGNRFRLRVRDVLGDRAEVDQALDRLTRMGMANYFGPQRFGLGGSNLETARALFGHRRIDRRRAGLALSAARGWLFNEVLARRVREGTWNRLVEGDLLVLDGTASFFPETPDDPSLPSRLTRLDLHPSGPLFGTGRTGTTGRAARIEADVARAWPDLVSGLADPRHRLRCDRRPLRERVIDLEWSWLDASTLELGFELRRGCFATAAVSQVVEVRAPSPAAVRVDGRG